MKGTAMSVCDKEEHGKAKEESSLVPTAMDLQSAAKLSTVMKSQVAMKSQAVTAAELNREFLRAANEDDDGYDPYSDRREYTPLFERDPWA